MKIRRPVAAAGAAVVLGTTGALVLPAAASAHNASHTLKFTAMTMKRAAFTKTNFGLQETDVNSTGKTIGFDDVNYTITGPSSATAGVAFDTMSGFLYGTVTTTNKGMTFKGKVTGGPARSRERPARSPPGQSAAPRQRSPSSTAKARQPQERRDGLRSGAVPPLPDQDR